MQATAPFTNNLLERGSPHEAALTAGNQLLTHFLHADGEVPHYKEI